LTLAESFKGLKALRADRQAKRLGAYCDWNSPPGFSIRLLLRAAIIIAIIMRREIIITQSIIRSGVYTLFMTRRVIGTTTAISTKRKVFFSRKVYSSHI